MKMDICMTSKRNSFHYIFIISFVSLVVLLSTSYSVFAYDDCPFGIEDDPHPGIYGRYVDSDNDGLCNHSQSRPSFSSVDPLHASPDIQTSTIGGVPLQENENLIKLIVSFVIIIIVYLVLHFITKSKRLSKAKERLIWNILLLIFFIPSALTGFSLKGKSVIEER